MAGEQFQAWNHFVPRLYLKRFAFSPGLLWHYPLLVSHDSVPVWNWLAISKAAAKRHLYTVASEADESDAIERWLAIEFDDPAEEAIGRAVGGRSMTRKHWRNLSRFFGAQYARTPANYLKSQERWKAVMSAQMEEVLKNAPQKFARMSSEERNKRIEISKSNISFPIRSSIKPSDELGIAQIKVEVIAGRKMWLWGLKRILRHDGPLSILEQHSWTILTAPDGCSWFTSDNPAVQLGWDKDGTRNLGGGWGTKGTELMLPLTPKQMLYTEIGVRSPEKYTIVSLARFSEMRRILSHNALRSIYSSSQDDSVRNLRPRHVDTVAFNHEEEQWKDWHEHHSNAERFVD